MEESEMKNTKKIFLGLTTILIIVVIGYFIDGEIASAQDAKAGSPEPVRETEDLKVHNDSELGQMDVVPFNEAASRMKIRRVQSPVQTSRQPEAAGTDQGSESEPNNSSATADALTGTDGRIKGLLLPTTAVPATNDVDYYSFTTTVPNSKIHAATMTFGSGGAVDTVLEVLSTDGTTVLELDDEDGSAMGGNSSSIAGRTLPAVGTYYLRVTNFSTTQPIAPYDLYFAVRDPATITAETEPNNNGTPQVLPASQYVSGAINPVADTDTFTFNAAAGDSVFLSIDLDPERDNVSQYNGRIGMGVFGTPGNFLVSSDSGAFDTQDSEAALFTVRTAGSYTVYTDAQTAGQGGPTATYNFTITVIPALPSGTCTTYASTTTPTALADLALTTSSITIPDSKIIRSLRVNADITHTNFPDLDANLRSPNNNDNGLFTDVGVSTQTGAQVLRLDGEASLPQVFTVINGVNWRTEALYNLNWFQGENAQGTWNLDIRDDLTANTGTLNSWSLEVCEEPVLTGNVIYNEDFEANNGGYTHSGTLDEWEYGTPATAGQTTVSPFTAPITTCASGNNCWKTDLDNTYENSSSMDLVSPTLNLTQYQGTINLYWQSRYQLESVAFDRAWVRVTNLNNPADTRMVWNSTNATMSEANGAGASLGNHAESAGWGRYSANISDFAGKTISVTFHLEADSSNVLAGWAVDDVQLRHVGVVAANVPVGGRVLSAEGRPLGNVRVTIDDSTGHPRTTYTNPFGYYRFDDVQAGRTYTLTASAKRYRFNPVIVTVGDEITGLDIIANGD
jgi:subtilisin-like proprotein convertase family protein